MGSWRGAKMSYLRVGFDSGRPAYALVLALTRMALWFSTYARWTYSYLVADTFILGALAVCVSRTGESIGGYLWIGNKKQKRLC